MTVVWNGTLIGHLTGPFDVDWDYYEHLRWEQHMSLQATEDASAAVAVAPRVSLADMEAKIAARYDCTASDALKNGVQVHDALKRLSICILVMQNGFSVIGKSAPASPENFNAELGRKFAYEDAIRQLWPLEGYLLRSQLAAAA